MLVIKGEKKRGCERTFILLLKPSRMTLYDTLKNENARRRRVVIVLAQYTKVFSLHSFFQSNFSIETAYQPRPLL